MTEQEKKAIRERLEKATPGPWLVRDQNGEGTVLDHEGCDVWPWHREEDMIFAYNAITDISCLLDALDEQDREVKRLRKVLEEIANGFELLETNKLGKIMQEIARQALAWEEK